MRTKHSKMKRVFGVKVRQPYLRAPGLSQAPIAVAIRDSGDLAAAVLGPGHRKPISLQR